MGRHVNEGRKVVEGNALVKARLDVFAEKLDVFGKEFHCKSPREAAPGVQPILTEEMQKQRLAKSLRRHPREVIRFFYQHGKVLHTTIEEFIGVTGEWSNRFGLDMFSQELRQKSRIQIEFCKTYNLSARLTEISLARRNDPNLARHRSFHDRSAALKFGFQFVDRSI